MNEIETERFFDALNGIKLELRKMNLMLSKMQEVSMRSDVPKGHADYPDQNCWDCKFYYTDENHFPCSRCCRKNDNYEFSYFEEE